MENDYNSVKVKSLLENVISDSPAEFTEAIFSFKENSLTRFAHNCVTQNVSRGEASVSVRVIDNGRMGRASSNRMELQSLTELPRTALEAAEVQREPDPELPSPPGPAEYQEMEAFFKSTAECTPGQRAAGISRAVKVCGSEGLSAAGIYTTGESAIAVANSKGVFAYHRGTSAEFSVSATDGDASGWAECITGDAEKIDAEQVARTAARKARLSRNPRSIEPGEYTVILEPAAVVEFLLFMSFYSFGALNYLEGRSFLSGKLGEQLLGKNITITDDAYHSLIRGMPFDFEGIPRQKVNLIDKGVAQSVVWDSATAKRGGTVSTGHALPQPNAEGPIPFYLRLKRGDSSREEMIASTDKGILVTHFHYTNVLDPIKLDMTGMTRDGTFMIDGSEIAYPVKNMRFTQSVVEALNRVVSLSQAVELHGTLFGGALMAPALKIEGFNFSSGTEF